MNLPADMLPVASPLEALQNLLKRFPRRGVIIGGIAASLLGKPRLTADLDVLLLASVDEIPAIIYAAAEEGIYPRIASAEAFGRKNRVLLLHHQASGTNIDMVLGFLPFEEETVARSQEIQVAEGLILQLPAPEDLIIMKAVAHRPKDLEDIRGIIEITPALDRERIEFWVRQFAEALDMPELWGDIKKLLFEN